MGIVGNEPIAKSRGSVIFPDVFSRAGRGPPPANYGLVNGVGVMNPCSTYLDYTNGVEYMNVGTKAAPVWAPVSSAQVGQAVKFSLTNAQVKTLFSVGTTVVPAPGAGLYLVPVQFAVCYNYGGVAFTGGGAVSFQYHGGGGNMHSGSVPASVIQAAANSATLLGPQNSATGLTLSANLGIDIVAATADFTAGNGTIDAIIWFATITL
jgi:hypothetical protein